MVYFSRIPVLCQKFDLIDLFILWIHDKNVTYIQNIYNII